MAVQAYVLIQTEPGKSNVVATELAGWAGVLCTADVTGPYDVIAKLEAETLDALGKMVVSSVHAIDGVVRTLTCPIVNL